MSDLRCKQPGCDARVELVQLATGRWQAVDVGEIQALRRINVQGRERWMFERVRKVHMCTAMDAAARLASVVGVVDDD
jgi:hypothetical protein